MDLKDLKQIVSMMSEHDLTEFKLDEDGTKLSIKRFMQGDPPPPAQVVVGAAPAHPMSMPMPAPMPAAPGAAPAAPAEAAGAAAANTKEVTSPMPGTFYRAPTPDAPSFVEIGDKVTPNTTVCIIEAMKVMNEIKAEQSGEIVDILIENGEAVEYGQAIFVIKP